VLENADIALEIQQQIVAGITLPVKKWRAIQSLSSGTSNG
jgi:hypothetical protein